MAFYKRVHSPLEIQSSALPPLATLALTKFKQEFKELSSQRQALQARVNKNVKWLKLKKPFTIEIMGRLRVTPSTRTGDSQISTKKRHSLAAAFGHWPRQLPWPGSAEWKTAIVSIAHTARDK